MIHICIYLKNSSNCFRVRNPNLTFSAGAISADGFGAEVAGAGPR